MATAIVLKCSFECIVEALFQPDCWSKYRILRIMSDAVASFTQRSKCHIHIRILLFSSYHLRSPHGNVLLTTIRWPRIGCPCNNTWIVKIHTSEKLKLSSLDLVLTMDFMKQEKDKKQRVESWDLASSVTYIRLPREMNLNVGRFLRPVLIHTQSKHGLA